MKLIEKPLVVFGLMLVAVGLMLHACWDGPFYRVDDSKLVIPAVEKPFTDIFRPIRGYLFAPVTELSLRVDYSLLAPPQARDAIQKHRTNPEAIFDLNQKWAGSLRILNGIYHLIAGMFLWCLIWRLGAGAGISATVALAWVAHPMACESVCWIVERKNVLAALFGFATLLAWTAPREKLWRWPLVYSCYALALLSKASALGILPVLFALEVTDPLHREFNWLNSRQWLKVCARLAVPVALSVGFSLITTYVYRSDIVDALGGSLFSTLLTDVGIFATYVRHILVPIGLSFYYAVEPMTSIGDFRFLASSAILLGSVVFAIRLSEPALRPLVILGLLWFFGALGPNSNIVATAFPMQDRFAYISAAGLLLATAVTVKSVLCRLKLERFLAYTGIGYVAAFAVLLTLRSPLFRNSDTVEADAARQQPKSGYAQLCVADRCRDLHIEFIQKGELKPAEFFGRLAATHYELADAASDIIYFQNRLVLRVRQAEMLIALGHLDRARTVLDGWLPPKDMPMHPEVSTTPRLTRREEYGGYYPATLSHGLGLMAEVSAQQALAPGLDVEKRIEFCERAIADADKARSVHLNDYQAELVKGRAFLILWHLKSQSGQAEKALQAFNQAETVLMSVPPGSGRYAFAQKLLSQARAAKAHPAPPKQQREAQ